MPIRRSVTIVLAVVIALLASSCTVTFLPQLDGGGSTSVDRPRSTTDESTSTVDRPRPPGPSPLLPGDEGFRIFEVAPRTIYPGTQVYFRVSVRRAGYLTVTALDPAGRATVWVRDFPIDAGGNPTRVPPVGTRRTRRGPRARGHVAAAGGVVARADRRPLRGPAGPGRLDRGHPRRPRPVRRGQRVRGQLRGAASLTRRLPATVPGVQSQHAPPWWCRSRGVRPGPGGVMEGRQRGGP